ANNPSAGPIFPRKTDAHTVLMAVGLRARARTAGASSESSRGLRGCAISLRLRTYVTTAALTGTKPLLFGACARRLDATGRQQRSNSRTVATEGSQRHGLRGRLN